MKTTDNDTELKKMIREIRLESPGPDFSTKVMQAVLAEARGKPVYTTEPLLGRKFWMLVALFVALAIAFMLFFGNETTLENGTIQQWLSGLHMPDLNPVKNILIDIFGKIGSLHWIVAAVMSVASVLILADKFLTDRNKLPAD